jgi:hypothetical protein
LHELSGHAGAWFAKQFHGGRQCSQLSCGPGCAGAMRGPDFELLSALVVYVHICIRCTELCTKLIHCMFDCVVVLVRCFLFVGDCW